MPPAFTPEHLLDERLVLTVDAAGDGGRIWSVRRPDEDGRGYTTELWHRPPGGEARQVALPFAPGARPRYDNTGRLVVVATDALWRASLDGDEPTQLTRDEHVLDAEPSPTDDRVLFRAFAGAPRFLVGDDVARRIDSPLVLADGHGFRDRWTHAFLWADGKVAQCTDGDYDVHACAWAADGSEVWLLVGLLLDRPYEVNQLWTMRPGNAPQVAVEAPGWVFDVALSPDATKLAWLARRGIAEETRLFVLDRASGETRQLDGGLCVDQATFPDVLPLQMPRTQLEWEGDDALLAVATVRGRPTLYRFPLAGRPGPALSGTCVGFLRRAAGATLLVGSDETGPAEAIELDGDVPRRLSAHGGWFPDGAWPRVTELSTDASGVEVHGWIVDPPHGAAPDAPVVLHVHGGPYSAHGPLPWLEMSALAARGYRVLVPNPRGSVSYGDDHCNAIEGRWGTVDADDLHAFVDAALESGGDPDRVGVVGLSYGGFMAVHLAGTSDRFRAVVAENPVTSFVSEFGMSDLGLFAADLFFGSEEIDLDAWLRASPLYRADRIQAPLLLLQGEADHRCPLPESMQVYTLLKALGREVELVRFPDESHLMFTLARPDRRLYRLECILEWFDRHLGFQP